MGRGHSSWEHIQLDADEEPKGSHMPNDRHRMTSYPFEVGDRRNDRIHGIDRIHGNAIAMGSPPASHHMMQARQRRMTVDTANTQPATSSYVGNVCGSRGPEIGRTDEIVRKSLVAVRDMTD